jgi:hypothetical protein
MRKKRGYIEWNFGDEVVHQILKYSSVHVWLKVGHVPKCSTCLGIHCNSEVLTMISARSYHSPSKIPGSETP